MKPNILLIRHAEAVGNKTRRIGYRDSEDYLTEEGKQQCLQLGAFVKKYVRRSLSHPFFLHCSQANRARETIKYSGIFDVPTRGNVIVTPHLNEIDVGSLNGKKITHQNRKELLSYKQDPTKNFPNGESIMDVQRRAVEYLLSLDPDRFHICISHGVLIASVMNYMGSSLRRIPENSSILLIYMEQGNLSLIDS